MRRKRKRITEVKIVASLYSYFQRCVDDLDKYAELYMAGANRDGVIVDAVYCERTGGCSVMPYVSEKELTRAYLEILARKFTPVAFIRVAFEDLEMYVDDNESGYDTYTHYGFPFISFSEEQKGKVVKGLISDSDQYGGYREVEDENGDIYDEEFVNGDWRSIKVIKVQTSQDGE